MIAGIAREQTMGRFWLFGACLAAAIFFVLSTVGGLPETVATHFAKNGAPDGWAKRDHYRTALLLVLTMMPMLVI
jgi:hypothetical protein